PQRIQSSGELEAAAADEREVLAHHGDRRVDRHQRTRLVDDLIGDPHGAGHHQAAGALAAGHGAAVDQQLVEPLAFGGHRPHARSTTTRAMWRRGSAPVPNLSIAASAWARSSRARCLAAGAPSTAGNVALWRSASTPGVLPVISVE